MNFFNFRTNSKKEEYKPLSNYCDWGMNMRSFNQCNEQRLEELVDILTNNHNTSINKAMSISSVYAATELISNSIASMPILVKKNNEVEDHNINYVLDNMLMTKFSFIKTIVLDMLIEGNGYAYIKRDRKGKIESLTYLKPQYVYIDYDEPKQTLLYKISYYENVPKVVEPVNILHIYKNSINGIEGRGFVHYGVRAIQQMRQVDDAASQLYCDGLDVEGYYTSDALMSHKQQQDMLQSIKEQQEQGKRRVFLPSKFSFISGANSARDSQLIENRLFSLQEICRYFCISPITIGDYSKGTSTGSLEDSQLQFLNNTILPYIHILEAEFNKKLLLPSEQKRYRIDFDENSLLRTNKQTLASYLQSLVSSGICSVNEARDVLGLQPKEGCDDLVIAYTKIDDNKLNGSSDDDIPVASDNTESESEEINEDDK